MSSPSDMSSWKIAESKDQILSSLPPFRNIVGDGDLRQLRARFHLCTVRMLAGWRTPLSTLLDPAQLLVEPHRRGDHQKYPRSDAEHAHRDGKPVDLSQQFRLLRVHVRTRLIQKQLVIPVHGKCAFVDQEDDQAKSEGSEDHRHDC